MRQAMILAAGLGTRLRPLTDTMPKALVPVGGKPLLAHVIERLQAAGYERIVVNVHHLADQVERYLRVNRNFGLDIAVSDERSQLLDTGGALKHAAPLFDHTEPILVHNVDIMDNVDYEWLRRQHLDDEDAVLLVSRRQTNRYLLFDNAMRLAGWTNTGTGEVKSPFPWMLRLTSDTLPPTLGRYAFSGIHSFSPRLFPLMKRFPDRFSIMDFYLGTCHRSRIMGCTKDGLQVLDVGKPGALEEAGAIYRKNNQRSIPEVVEQGVVEVK